MVSGSTECSHALDPRIATRIAEAKINVARLDLNRQARAHGHGVPNARSFHHDNVPGTHVTDAFLQQEIAVVQATPKGNGIRVEAGTWEAAVSAD
jgi:hypothetical protein